MIMMMAFWLILLIVPLLLIGVVVYALGWQTQSNQASQTPLEILNARYADGEITHEEYEQMHRDLEG